MAKKKLLNKCDIRIVFDDGSYARYTIRPDGPLAQDRTLMASEIRKFLHSMEVTAVEESATERS